MRLKETREYGKLMKKHSRYSPRERKERIYSRIKEKQMNSIHGRIRERMNQKSLAPTSSYLPNSVDQREYSFEDTQRTQDYFFKNKKKMEQEDLSALYRIAENLQKIRKKVDGMQTRLENK